MDASFESRAYCFDGDLYDFGCCDKLDSRSEMVLFDNHISYNLFRLYPKLSYE